ncbi:hypothetical protein LJ655_00550 [Paraburkholderia sp. MMS20-SJTN17]|uniref:HNH endonuclease n=1 Tax=Paraburkholderia translucens TaxID=2886945 RepID=A0ABS8K6M7_9BURK|nr:hypothetical protein [Paraburkholderia sp. MMS20-SJTN17]MCC8400393.1 hypothetical protein [Paraburkholderia sp. MMS20-SJTN17]
MEQRKQNETVDKEECDLCRITYSIYSKFPPMPSAKALNAETGEWFPFDRLRSYSNGYRMAEALGYAWACDCRGRSEKSFDQHFRLTDQSTGTPLQDIPYRIISENGRSVEHRTDAQGRTVKVSGGQDEGVTLHVFEEHAPIDPEWDKYL